jgi:hypothetical protein
MRAGVGASVEQIHGYHLLSDGLLGRVGIVRGVYGCAGVSNSPGELADLFNPVRKPEWETEAPKDLRHLWIELLGTGL